mgnify:CR=1 FL=1
MDGVRLAANAADIGHVVRMVQSLTDAVNGPLECDPAWTGGSVLRLIQSDTGAVLISDGGFIAGEVVRTIISPVPVAFEHGWFASDRSGLRLLSAFEAWAAEMGCQMIKMSTAANASGAGKILRRRGYAPAELAWVK